MKRIFVSGNYLIIDGDDGDVKEIPTVGSFYIESNGVFRIHNKQNGSVHSIAFADAGDWYDEVGFTAFTESTLRTFLRTYTGFNSATGGSVANFATEDLLFEGNRSHNTDGFSYSLSTDGDINESWHSMSTTRHDVGFGSSYMRASNGSIDLITENLGITCDAIFSGANINWVMPGALSSDKWVLFDSEGEDELFSINGSGLTSANKALEVRHDSDTALAVYSGMANAPIHRMYNQAGNLICDLREAGGAALAYFMNSLGEVNISFNASSGILDATNGFSVNGVGGAGLNTGTTYTFGGGSTGDVATMTFAKGILISVTTVP